MSAVQTMALAACVDANCGLESRVLGGKCTNPLCHFQLAAEIHPNLIKFLPYVLKRGRGLGIACISEQPFKKR